MAEIIAMRLLIALTAFAYGASALPADPTITERAHLGSIEARSNSDFIGWFYDSTYSIYQEDSCPSTDYWQLNGKYGGCCTTTASILGCAYITGCTSGSIRVGVTAEYGCPASIPICNTNLVIDQLGGKTTTTYIFCDSVSTVSTFYVTLPTLSISSISESSTASSTTSTPTSVTSSSIVSSTSTSSSFQKSIFFSVTVNPNPTLTHTTTATAAPGHTKGVIIGGSVGAIGGLALICALVALTFYLRKKNNRNQSAPYLPPPQQEQQQQYYPPHPPQSPPPQQQQQQHTYYSPQPQSPPLQGFYSQAPSPPFGNAGAKMPIYSAHPVEAPRGGAVELRTW